jgi:Tfp pilus assembly protein PilW
VKQLFRRVHQWLITTHSSPSPRAGDHGGHGDHGASLVEVMVAMVISAVLLASIVGLLDSSSSAARSMETRAEINERSALLQDRLGAVLRGATSVTFASETEICTTARSRVPIDQVTTLSATAYESAPRDTCVRVEGSTIQAVTTTSGSPSSELILNGATGSAFTFFDAEATALTVDPVTGQISDTDLALIRRVGVHATTVTDRLGRTSEQLQMQFAVGAARFSAEQSWRGRAGSLDQSTTSGEPG